MKRIHLCAGSVYLTGFENCDVIGEIVDYSLINDGIVVNPNETTLSNYFTTPFEEDFDKRIKKEFIIDTKMNILEKWRWEDNSVDEIVMINAWEHFIPVNELLHIRDEIKRVLKIGGVFIVNFPNILEIVDKYYESEPHKCMELIYCNNKNKFSTHYFGYTPETFKTYWPESYKVEEKTIVKTDHPMIGMVVIKHE